jgi:hypothetical protein
VSRTGDRKKSKAIRNGQRVLRVSSLENCCVRQALPATMRSTCVFDLPLHPVMDCTGAVLSADKWLPYDAIIADARES